MQVILVADRTKSHHAAPEHAETLEFLEDRYFTYIASEIESFASLVHYSDPKRLVDNAHAHKDDIILSLYSGKRSRFRKALVASICESYQLMYVGADPYAHIIAQDKYLSKILVRRCGMDVPEGILCETQVELGDLHRLNLPLVVKPNFEGGSIGISSKNLATTFDSARTRVAELVEVFEEPVLIEEFCPGREVSIVIAGPPSSPLLFEAVETTCSQDGKPLPLDQRLFSHELKKTDHGIESESLIVTHELSSATTNHALEVYRKLGKVDFMRVDGRLDRTGRFTCIELSPDAYLGPGSSFLEACDHNGIIFKQFLEQLFAAAKNGGFRNASEK